MDFSAKGRDHMIVKELKPGTFFTLKPLENPKDSQVYVRGAYDRSEKKFECQKFSDISSCRYLKGTTEVFTDFIF